MRLLNVWDFSFCVYSDKEAPEYCILSHTWDGGEIEFSDVCNEKSELWKSRGPGYQKVVGACKVARRLRYDWIWIDTCCINKENVDEAWEAINSMFQWYSNAKMCIAYLINVSFHRDWRRKFRRSRWFTRGWTLQELLAPPELYFYDHEFEYLGSRDGLIKGISRITGIETRYLKGHGSFNNASVATKMSWASRRETTLEQDKAYCLIGLFGVNMQRRHAEGKKAFIRLQQEIMNTVADESLFAWIAKGARDDDPYGMLAPEPEYFKHSAGVWPLSSGEVRHISWSAGCVELAHGRSRLSTVSVKAGGGLVPLYCEREREPGIWETVAIHLRKREGVLHRWKCSSWQYAYDQPHTSRVETLHIAQPGYAITPPVLAANREREAAKADRKEKKRVQGLALAVTGGLAFAYAVRQISRHSDQGGGSSERGDAGDSTDYSGNESHSFRTSGRSRARIRSRARTSSLARSRSHARSRSRTRSRSRASMRSRASSRRRASSWQPSSRGKRSFSRERSMVGFRLPDIYD